MINEGLRRCTTFEDSPGPMALGQLSLPAPLTSMAPGQLALPAPSISMAPGQLPLPATMISMAPGQLPLPAPQQVGQSCVQPLPPTQQPQMPAYGAAAPPGPGIELPPTTQPTTPPPAAGPGIQLPPNTQPPTPPPGTISLTATTNAIRDRLTRGKANAEDPGQAVVVAKGPRPKPPTGQRKKVKKAAKPAKPERKVWTTRPPLPSLGAEGVFYKGGVIYTSTKRKAFRVIQLLPDYGTEACVKWSGQRPTASEWTRALKKIDTYKKKK